MKKFRFDVVIRIVADAIMVNASLLVGLFVGVVLGKFGVATALDAYQRSYWLLTVVSLVTFHTMGFYTKGRFYRSRYKALVICQATALAFVLYGFGVYVSPLAHFVPRSALPPSWMTATVLLVCARLFISVWELVTDGEKKRTAAAALPRPEKTVLVIGGGGYIGSALVPKLLANGYHVRLLDCFLYGEEPIAAVRGHSRLEILRADFRSIDAVVRAMRGMSEVVHLGAIVGDPACALDEELTVEINLSATRMLAEVAKGEGVSRFVFASTCSVYGASDEILDERSTLNPVSLYAKSKIACERVLLGMAQDGFRPVLLRFGTIYGLSGRTRFDLVVNLLTAKALVDGVIPVSGPDQWRPFVHVDDAARAVLKSLQARPEQLSDIIFNVGSDEQNRTLGDVGELVHRFVPNSQLVITSQNGDRRNYRVNFRRIRQVLDFEPRWSLAGGVEQVLDALRSGKVVDYRDPRYSNVQFLKSEVSRKLAVQRGWEKQLLEEQELVNAPGEMAA